MSTTTCAACDCELNADPIKVKVGGKTVEVCCEECARSLKEADAATSGNKLGKE
jgi:Archaeal TRASH domain